MIKMLIYLFVSLSDLLLPTLSPIVEINDLLELRRLCYAASEDSEKTEELYNLADAHFPDLKAEERGYKAMALLLRAKHAFNPYNKIKYFLAGRDALDEAIVRNDANTELHFLRFAAEDNAPIYLGYRDDLEADEAFLQAFISKGENGTEDPDLKTRITNYFNERARR